VHAPKGTKLLKAASEIELCGTCHRNITNRQKRFNHMPVREDKISCSSCHNVHGSSNARLLKVGTSVDESCTSCHTEKRGPYLWEHAPVADSCVTCHDPHGSNNDRMLVAKQPFLCQRCHVTSRHPPTVYDGFVLKNSSNANKIFGRSCVVCHQMVHGSNSPNGKAFLR
jgi:DmsE family decaheme c-type cytochrome